MNTLTCFSKTVEEKITNLDPYEGMTIFPNPSFTKEIKINTPIDFEKGVLQLIDLKGQVQYEETVQNNKNPIVKKFTSINPGIYLLRIICEKWVGQGRLILLE